MTENKPSYPIHETPLRKVYFADTDAAGVVHHSQYVRWFEAGRIDFLDELGCTYAEFQKEHIGFVPVAIQLHYKHPLRFGDFYKIQTELKQIKKASVVFFSRIISQEDIVCCEADVTLACMNEKNWKLIKVPEKLLKAISPLT